MRRPLLSQLSLSLILVFHYASGLILYPYKTMRKITAEKDYYQVGIIFACIYGYFILAAAVRQKTFQPLILTSSAFLSFIFFLGTFFLVVSFFYVLSTIFKNKINISALIFSFAYSLLPTFFWFLVTSLLYYFIPPPRTFSVGGKSFSIFFTIFSLSLLSLRIILYYLSLRFSLKLGFYTIVLFTFIFSLWFLPYSYFMYQLKIFRIPFI